MSDPSQKPQSWTKLLNRYHWFVLIVASLGWLFDCLDQQLFNLARVPAMRELVTEQSVPEIVQNGASMTVEAKTKLVEALRKQRAGDSTAVFLIGWATGGLIFGMLGDRIGRSKTMMITILLYSLCTGLSALSKSFYDFAFYRFITGLGVGGEFAVGVALVAEVMPDKARAQALGLLQAFSTVGNIAAAFISLYLGHLEESGAIGAAWRWMFVIGAAPALLAVVVRMKLKEPQKWVEMKESGRLKQTSAFTYGPLFATPRWRKNAILGMLIASVGVIGTWGIGFFSIDLTRYVFRTHFTNLGYQGKELAGMLTKYAAYTSLMLNVGGFFGMLTFSKIAQSLGRRPALALSFITAGLSIASVFLFLKTPSQIWWHIPIMGFFQMSVFACYAIYLPELFPTEIRSTGTSFCYNVGRYIAAAGPLTLGLLTSQVFAGHEEPLPFRYAGVTMCLIFVIGLFLLPFAPETKDKPLPENERGFAH